MFDIDTTIEIDLNEVEKFCTQELPSLLINNCTDISIPAFILQAVLKEINTLRDASN